MKKFYEYYSLADEKVRQLVALLPWKHNLLIMSSANSIDEALYYVELTHENNLSRNILLNFIKTDRQLQERKTVTQTQQFCAYLTRRFTGAGKRNFEILL